MNAVIAWGGFLLLIFAIAYVVTHKSFFDTVWIQGDDYRPSRIYETKYGGTFKTKDYKLKHNAVMFAEVVDTHGFLEHLLVIDTEFKDFVRDGKYLFRQGKQYRIATCKAASRGFPPIFDGHETLITHDCLGYVVGELNPKTGEVISY